MTEYLELQYENQVDRLKVIGIPVNDFLDIFYKHKKSSFKPVIISEREFEDHPNRNLCFHFNVENCFEAIHYVVKHETPELEEQWNTTVNYFYRLDLTDVL